MVSKNIMNLISLGIHIFPILIKFLLCFGRASLYGKVGEGRRVCVRVPGWAQLAVFNPLAHFHSPSSSEGLGSLFLLH